MKTKIGERSRKPKIHGLKGFFKAYPGAAVLAGLIVVGGVGMGAMTMVGANNDEQVLENNPPVVEQIEQNEKEEVTSKSLDEAVEEIVAAGAKDAAFTATENAVKLDVVVDAQMTDEDVKGLDAVIKELLCDPAFVEVNLFENTEDKLNKSYEINYLLGEDSENAAYTSSASYSSGPSRKGGMLYVLQKAWAGPEAVEVEESGDTVVLENQTPASTENATPTTNNTTGTAENQTGTTSTTTAPSTETPATTTPEATTTTPSTEAAADKKAPSKEEEIKASTTNLASKAKQYKTSINSDIIGWLNIPGTGIDYPVTHTNNNTYYMNHNIYKQADRDGALLTDYECNFKNGLPTNTVIYGHNWNNYLAPLADNNPKDKMFDEVHKYADATFAGNHPYIYFSTTEKNYKYQVFAAFYTHVNWTDYLYCYPNATRMQNIISTAKKSSLHDFGVGVSTSDKIISLSTCTRMKGNTNQYRFVVMAKLVG